MTDRIELVSLPPAGSPGHPFYLIHRYGLTCIEPPPDTDDEAAFLEWARLLARLISNPERP